MKLSLLFCLFSLPFLSAFAQEKPDRVFLNPEGELITNCWVNLPAYPGGEQAMINFLGNHIDYPITTENPQGMVVVSFIVEKNGILTDIKIVKSLHPAFDSISKAGCQKNAPMDTCTFGR